MAYFPKAVVEVTASSRTLGQTLGAARDRFAAFGRDIRKNVLGKQMAEKGFMGGAGASMLGNLGARGAQALGGFLVDQYKDVTAFNDALVRLQITARKSPEYMAEFGRSVRTTSDQTGVAAREILDGAAAYVALTGDMEGASKASNQWARVAQATNSTVSDIAQTAAAMKQNLKINPEDMEAAFSALAVQGKEGAIELKDLAAELSTIAPQWANFGGGGGVQGLKELGAAMQVVKWDFGGDVGETTTGMQSFLNAVIGHAAKLKRLNVDVYDKNGNLNNVLDIVDQIGSSKLIKNKTILKDALGRVEAMRAYDALHKYRAEIDGFVVAASDATVIQKDLDSYLQSSAGRSKLAWTQAKNEIAAAFTPERIELFTRAVTGAVSALAKVISAISGILDAVARFGQGGAKDVREHGGQGKIGMAGAPAIGGIGLSALDQFKDGGALSADEIMRRGNEASDANDHRRALRRASNRSSGRVAQGFIGTGGGMGIDTVQGHAMAAVQLGIENARKRSENETRAIVNAINALHGKLHPGDIVIGADKIVEAGRAGGNAHHTRPPGP